MTSTVNGFQKRATLVDFGSGSFTLYTRGQLQQLCETVHDESDPGYISPNIQKMLESYDRAGVDLHVLVINDARSLGLANTSDEGRANFADLVVEQCGWKSQNPNQVVAIISYGTPRTGFLHRIGQPEIDITSPMVDSQAASFQASLSDTLHGRSNMSWQDDLAQLLNNVNPYDNEAEIIPTGRPILDSPIQNTPVVAETLQPEKPGAPINKPLVIGIPAGVAILGAFGGRQYGRHKAKQLFDAAETAIREAQNNVATFTTEENLLRDTLTILKDEDIPKEKALLEKVEVHGVELKNAREELEEARKQNLKFRVPITRVSRVREITERLTRIANIANKDAIQLAADAERLQELMNNIDNIKKNFSTLVDDIQALIDQKVADGWNMIAYMDERTSYEASETEVERMRADNLVVQPSELMDDVDDKIKQTVIDVELLPDRLAKMTRDYSMQPETMKSSNSLIELSKEVLAQIKDLYDATCFSDIENNENDFDILFATMTKCNQDAKSKISVKDAQMVIDIEALDATFDSAKAQVDSIAENIKQRFEHLGTLVEVLPIKFVELMKYNDATINIGVSANGDVEMDTRNKMEAIKDLISAGIVGLKETKPKYLQLETTRDSLAQKCEAIRERAQAEIQEMKQLRQTLTQKHNEAVNDRQQLDNKCSDSDVDSSTRARARSIQITAMNTGDSRQGLKRQIAELESDIGEISSVYSQALSDIRQAEAEREAQRQAEMAAERAADAARNASHNGGTSDGVDFN